MPEGPAILHLKNQLLPFKGKIVKQAGGYGKMPTAWINNKKLLDILTWGKHLLFVFSNGTVRVHLGLFGEILVNERKKVNASFFIHFVKGEINGYVVRAQKLEKPLEEVYDWTTDILSPEFNRSHVKNLLKNYAGKTVPAFWNDMAKAEAHDDYTFDFLRTHPYSDTRSTCLVNHIKNNFKLDCK